jgi:hypothetical protein
MKGSRIPGVKGSRGKLRCRAQGKGLKAENRILIDEQETVEFRSQDLYITFYSRNLSSLEGEGFPLFQIETIKKYGNHYGFMIIERRE